VDQAGGIEPVHRGPPVGAVTDVAGDATLPGDADQRGHEAVVALAVHRRSESQADHAHVLLGVAEGELLKLSGLAEAAAQALRRRDVPNPAAALAAEAGVVAFKLGFEKWIGSDSSGSLAGDIRATRDALVSLAAGS
jgi:hypothetical protein